MFKTPPPMSKSNVANPTPSKATPHAAKFRLRVPDINLILQKINDFSILIETVRRVVDDCGGVINEGKLLGGLLLTARRTFTMRLVRLRSVTK